MNERPTDVDLTPGERKRYGRHLIMPEVGLGGQQKLKAARILVIGIGGLGSPVTMYLAAAGVGTIGIVDDDVIDTSNLHRQIIYSTRDAGEAKLPIAAQRIAAINPLVHIRRYETRLTSANALEILKDYDVVVDGTDNFPTRYLVNDACVLLGIPNVYGSIFRFEGRSSVFVPKQGPCYRCMCPEPPAAGMVPNCAESGVFGVLPGIIGTIQANEALKLVLGIGDLLVGRLLLFDALSMKFTEIRLRRNPACPICGDTPTIDQLIDYEEFCKLGTRSHPQEETLVPSLSVHQLKEKLDHGEDLFLLDVREQHEYELVNLKGYLLPVREIKTRFHELDPSKEIIVYCHVGGRSAHAVRLLQERGFRKVYNLSGGIDAWAAEIDLTLPRY
ncbi:MAG TPA: molybdenum cofactor biosynthesis protein MoeB [Bacteroidetes bacterium]|nr:molybdenum cofactor biosynthesis protein MoeB [Bacteroidota bacterium]